MFNCSRCPCRLFKRLTCLETPPTLDRVAGLHYHLKLLFPDSGGAVLHVTLYLCPAARTQLQHLQRSQLAASLNCRLLQARLASTSTPVAAAERYPGAEMWAVWRLGGGSQQPDGSAAAVDISSLRTAVDASDESAITSALCSATAALLGERRGAAKSAVVLDPEGQPAAPQQQLLLQALPVQRLGGRDGGSGDKGVGEDSLLWPPDHMALFPLASCGNGSSGGSGGAADVVLELHVVTYGGEESSSSGGGGGILEELLSSEAADGNAALVCMRQAQQAALKHHLSQHPDRQQTLISFINSRLLARAVVRQDALPSDRPGEPLILDGLAMADPAGRAVGTATIEAVPWSTADLLAHLTALSGPDCGGEISTSSGGAPQQWPDSLLGPSGLPSSGAAAAAAGLLGAYGRSAAAILLETLGRDMVAKQAALERLQRQVDAADARWEAAAGRLRDLQNRNQ